MRQKYYFSYEIRSASENKATFKFMSIYLIEMALSFS